MLRTYYCENIFLKRSIPTVCLAYMGIDPSTWNASLIQRILWLKTHEKDFQYIQYPADNPYNITIKAWEDMWNVYSMKLTIEKTYTFTLLTKILITVSLKK